MHFPFVKTGVSRPFGRLWRFVVNYVPCSCSLHPIWVEVLDVPPPHLQAYRSGAMHACRIGKLTNSASQSLLFEALAFSHLRFLTSQSAAEQVVGATPLLRLHRYCRSLNVQSELDREGGPCTAPRSHIIHHSSFPERAWRRRRRQLWASVVLSRQALRCAAARTATSRSTCGNPETLGGFLLSTRSAMVGMYGLQHLCHVRYVSLSN